MTLRLDTMLDSKFDSLFKSIITAGWCVKSDGHVEAPQGYFSITEIPALPGELREMFEAVEEGTWEEWYGLPSGWYFTTENSDGVIFVYPCSQADAEAAFSESLAGYSMWDVY